MIRTKISAYWAAVTGAVTFLVGAVVTPLTSAMFHNDELNEHERTFVMDVVKLEIEHPERAVSTAQLSTLVSRHYIRNAKFADDFSNVLAGEALSLAGANAIPISYGGGGYGGGLGGGGYGAYPDADYPSAYPGGPSAPQTPATMAAGAASSLSQVKAAEKVASVAMAAQKSGAVTPQVVREVLQPTKARIFFQIAEEAQRPDARDLRGQLQSILRQGASVNGDELVARFNGGAQVRYFYADDQAEANRIASILKVSFPKLACLRIGGYDTSAGVRPRLFEVWLGKGDHPIARLANAPLQQLCR